MSALFYAVVAIACLVAIVLVWLLVDWAWRKFDECREKRALRIRDQRSSWDLVKPYEPSARERRL